MRILVIGAGVTGSLLAAGLHQAGHDVTLLARGQRLTDLRRHGVRLAEGDSTVIRQVPVPVVDKPAAEYDLIAVSVRPHQVDSVLDQLTAVDGDVVFMLNWAGGAAPLQKALGPGRVLLASAAGGGTLDGDVIRHRPPGVLTRLARMPIGEPDGRTTPRVQRIVRMFRDAGFHYRIEPDMESRLRSHAAFEVPFGQAVHQAGGPTQLAADPEALRTALRGMRRELTATGGFAPLRKLPEPLLVPVLRSFLRSSLAVNSGLSTISPSSAAEYRHLSEQLRAFSSR
ncbi:ketopantoate reductase family protein [Actinoplanes couchii]|nr:ketopantoate reductase family protein [Actinoplanes couchii]MDR6319127.1 2-dehydropantoate 2-reductase [Actinoplanes couchii]